MSVSFSTIIQKARLGAVHTTTKALKELICKLPPTNVIALQNGVRVAAEENVNAKLATVGIWTDCGSRYEPNHLAGMTKVLEKCGLLHTTHLNKSQIAAAIDELGGQLAMNVGREHSYIYMKVAKEDVNKAVGVLSDIVCHARLADEDIMQAKKLVEVEQHLLENRPDDLVEDNLHRCCFDSTSHGLGTPLYGNEETLNHISANDLKQHRSACVSGNRTVLVGTGAVNTTELEKAAQSYLGDLPSGEEVLPNLPETRYVGGEYRLWNLRFKTLHTAWAFQTCGAACEDNVPLMLACEIPGSFHRSQHELGQHAMHRVLKTFSSLDHSTPTNTHFNEKCIEIANPFLHSYRDVGLCGMYVVGRPGSAGPGDGSAMVEILQYTLYEWCRFTQKMLHDKELAQAKVNLKAQLLFNMDGSGNAAQDIGRQIFHYGRRIPLQEMYDRIDDITATNVQEVLQHYFYGRKPCYSFLGYLNGIPNYDWTEHWTYRYWY